MVKTTPALAQKDRLETYPAWSPDGRFLYFCSAPLTWTDRNVIPAQYDQIKYDLVRVAYDVHRDAWGPAETILSAQDTGLSILEPRISPDGRWLLFCMCKYGCFPVYQQSSDLYLIDLEAAERTGRYEYRRLEVNSDESESWHSWSSNSRWIAFSSKREMAPSPGPTSATSIRTARLTSRCCCPRRTQRTMIPASGRTVSPSL